MLNYAYWLQEWIGVHNPSGEGVSLLLDHPSADGKGKKEGALHLLALSDHSWVWHFLRLPLSTGISRRIPSKTTWYLQCRFTPIHAQRSWENSKLCQQSIPHASWSFTGIHKELLAFVRDGKCQQCEQVSVPYISKTDWWGLKTNFCVQNYKDSYGLVALLCVHVGPLPPWWCCRRVSVCLLWVSVFVK